MNKLKCASLLVTVLLVSLTSCVSDTKSDTNDTVNQGSTTNQEMAANNVSTEQNDHAGHNHSSYNNNDHEKSKPVIKGASQQTQPTQKVAINQPQKKVTSNTTVKSKSDQIAEIDATSDGIDPSSIAAKKAAIQNSKQVTTSLNNTTAALPNACSLINTDYIGQVIGVDGNLISIKDGSSSASKHARSCFFRWEHNGVPNSGVLIQVMENPLPEEVNDWAAYYIQAKLHQGDVDPTGNQSFKYKALDGLGVAGAYNFDMHRYLWRIEEDIVYMVAFNLPATEDQEVKWVKALGKEIMNNYKS